MKRIFIFTALSFLCFNAGAFELLEGEQENPFTGEWASYFHVSFENHNLNNNVNRFKENDNHRVTFQSNGFAIYCFNFDFELAETYNFVWDFRSDENKIAVLKHGSLQENYIRPIFEIRKNDYILATLQNFDDTHQIIGIERLSDSNIADDFFSNYSLEYIDNILTGKWVNKKTFSLRYNEDYYFNIEYHDQIDFEYFNRFKKNVVELKSDKIYEYEFNFVMDRKTIQLYTYSEDYNFVFSFILMPISDTEILLISGWDNYFVFRYFVKEG